MQKKLFIVPALLISIATVCGCKPSTSSKVLESKQSNGNENVNHTQLALIVTKVDCKDDGTAENCDLFNSSGSKVADIACSDGRSNSEYKFVSLPIRVAGYNETGRSTLAHHFTSLEECKSTKDWLKKTENLPQVLQFTLASAWIPGYAPSGTIKLMPLVGGAKNLSSSGLKELALIVSKVECKDDGTADNCDLFNSSGSKVASLACSDGRSTSQYKFVSLHIHVAGYETGGSTLAHDFTSLEECIAARDRLRKTANLPQVLQFTLASAWIPGYAPSGKVKLMPLVEWAK